MKKLRLSGINQTLAERNRQAVDNQLSYTEFFGLLLQDEILRRDQSQYDRRLRQAGFKGNKTLENFDFTFNPKINQQLIKDLATCRFVNEKAPVLIIGPCGTGKSHLAQALGHCAIRHGLSVTFTTQTQIAHNLAAAKATGTFHNTFKKFINTQLLIIDDLGLKPLQSPEVEYLHEIIAERYENKPTLVTSNLDINEWQDAFPNKLLGAATIDRLQHHAYQLLLEGKSYRTIKQPENQKTTT
jgi:DNA replication protein DnaC